MRKESAIIQLRKVWRKLRHPSEELKDIFEQLKKLKPTREEIRKFNYQVLRKYPRSGDYGGCIWDKDFLELRTREDYGIDAVLVGYHDEYLLLLQEKQAKEFLEFIKNYRRHVIGRMSKEEYERQCEHFEGQSQKSEETVGMRGGQQNYGSRVR
ncbi:MAG: hypothetical protein QXK47_05920 [Candidatus Bathyarchaeia archaeon]